MGDQLERLQELLEKQEELDVELEDYIDESGPFGPMIKHPLVFSIMHHPGMNAMVNSQLKGKKEALAKAYRDKNWNTYVYLHERPYRLDAFMEITHILSDSQYWELLGDIWTDTENMYQQEDEWRTALMSQRPGRELMMDADERKALDMDFDDTIRVYRGFHIPGREMGLSWTSNSVVAKFFARRLAQAEDTCFLAKGTVDKSNVVAFFDGRSESEIVLLPEDVVGIEITEVTHGD